MISPDNYKKPLVSFILIGYNQERYVREAVNGVLSQTYSPLEIVLSDDCSKDNTYRVMSEMAADYKGAHKIILNRNETNLHVGRHVNRAMELATGEFIVMGACDDISLPRRVQTLYEKWRETDGRAFCIMSNAAAIDQNGKVIASHFFHAENDTNPGRIVLRRYDDRVRVSLLKTGYREVWYASGVLGATNAIQRKIYDEFGPLWGTLFGEDEALCYRANILGGVAYVDEPLVLYRRHTEHLVPDDVPPEKKAHYDYVLNQHIVRLDENNLRDTKTAFKKRFLSRSQARYFETRFRWELQRGQINILSHDRRWFSLAFVIVKYIAVGIRRKKMVGWLLWRCDPSLFAWVRRWTKHAKLEATPPPPGGCAPDPYLAFFGRQGQL
ncbi:MAG: glycosyltransferase [Verrucomicrobiota bacterium]